MPIEKIKFILYVVIFLTFIAVSFISRHSIEIITSRPFSPLSLLTSTILFTILWMPTNYLYVKALQTIPATDVTAIFSTAPAFVFIFSMIILREPPLVLRVRGVQWMISLRMWLYSLLCLIIFDEIMSTARWLFW